MPFLVWWLLDCGPWTGSISLGWRSLERQSPLPHPHLRPTESDVVSDLVEGASPSGEPDAHSSLRACVLIESFRPLSRLTCGPPSKFYHY